MTLADVAYGLRRNLTVRRLGGRTVRLKMYTGGRCKIAVEKYAGTTPNVSLCDMVYDVVKSYPQKGEAALANASASRGYIEAPRREPPDSFRSATALEVHRSAAGEVWPNTKLQAFWGRLRMSPSLASGMIKCKPPVRILNVS